MRSTINTLLTLLFLMILLALALPSFAEDKICPVGIKQIDKSWLWDKYGDSPYICVNGCKSELTGVSICSVNGNLCTGDFMTTGSECPQTDGIVAGGDFPTNSGGGVIPPFNGIGGADSASMYTAENLKGLNVLGDMIETNIEQTLRTQHLISVLDGSLAGTVNDIGNAANQVTTSMSSFDTKFSNNLQLLEQLDVDRKLDKQEYLARFDTVDSTLDTFQTDLSKDLDDLEVLTNDAASYARWAFDAAKSTDIIVKNNDALIRANKRAIDDLEWIAYDTNDAVYNNNDLLVGQNDKISQLSSDINALSTKIDGLDGGSGGDNSSVIEAVNNVGSNVNALGEKLDALGDALIPTDYAERDAIGQVDFEGLDLYQSAALEVLEQETEQLKLDYQSKVEEFRNLFSFDTSLLNGGDYVEHSFLLTLSNGAKASGISGVFPALIDNSALIAAVLIFLAAVLGSRFIF